MPQGAWAQMYLINERGDDIWCEDIYVALNTLRNESWMFGDGPVTMRFDSDNALSEELDCQSLGRDITIDLNGYVLTNESWAVDWMSCIVAFPSGCENRITIQNGTIESNELNAIYFHGDDWNLNQKLILKNVNVVTHQEGRHCLFDAMSWDWEDWGYDGDPESSPKLQIIDSQFHSNGCSAISFTLLRNDEYVKSILPEGYSFYNANTDVELAEYADRPFVDENGNPATDIRTGVSQDLPKIKISDSDGYGYYCGNFKQAMDIYGFYGMTLTLLDDVKEGLCTTNFNFRSVTIDLNGHTLDITHLYTYGGEYLNIIDSSEGKTGKLIVERFYVDTPAENNAVIEGNVITRTNDCFTNNGLVEYVDGGFINNGDFITSWTWADDHSSATLRINHEDVDAVLTNEDTTPATCIASGVRTYTAAATYRDRNYADTKDEEIAIDPNAHDYLVQQDENEKPVFVWSEDYTSATLQVVCSHNAEHTANVEVTGEGITSADTTPATCITTGVRTYTATATYEGEEYTGTKNEKIPQIPHDFTSHTLTDGPVTSGLYAYTCDYGCWHYDEHRFIKDFYGEGNHLELTEDGAGNYSTSEDIILADANGFAAPIDFIANSVTYTRTGIKNQWGTIVVPFDVNGIGADYDLYKLDQVSDFDEQLVLTKIDEDDNGGIVPAGTPVIFRLHDNLAGDYTLTLTAANTTVSCWLEEGSDADGFQIVGTYETIQLNEYDYYISKNMFWMVGDVWAAGVKVAPFRAYIHPTWAMAKPHTLSISIADEDVTAVDALNALTEGNAEYYDMNGRKLNSLQKGVNIVKMSNGKTVKVNIK